MTEPKSRSLGYAHWPELWGRGVGDNFKSRSLA